MIAASVVTSIAKNIAISSHQFDVDAMSNVNPLLGTAGRLMSDSYQATRVIEALAHLVIGSRQTEANGDETLHPETEECLLLAITMLARSNNNDLGLFADRSRAALAEKKGAK